jgi:hypothetical protein
VNDDQFREKSARTAELFAQSLREQAARVEAGDLGIERVARTLNEHLAEDDGDDRTWVPFPTPLQAFDAWLEPRGHWFGTGFLAFTGFLVGVAVGSHGFWFFVALLAAYLLLAAVTLRAALLTPETLA